MPVLTLGGKPAAIPAKRVWTVRDELTSYRKDNPFSRAMRVRAREMFPSLMAEAEYESDYAELLGMPLAEAKQAEREIQERDNG